jgi:hypothetical protein
MAQEMAVFTADGLNMLCNSMCPHMHLMLMCDHLCSRMLVHAGDGRFIVTAWAIAYSMHPQLVVDSIAILGGLKLLLRCRSSSHHKVFNRGTVATLLVFSVSSIQVCADDGASRMQAMGAYCGISNRRAMCWLIGTLAAFLGCHSFASRVRTLSATPDGGNGQPHKLAEKLVVSSYFVTFCIEHITQLHGALS